MPSLALACRLSAATAAIQSLFKRAKSISRRYNEPLLAIEDDFLELGEETTLDLSEFTSVFGDGVLLSASQFSSSGAGGVQKNLALNTGKSYLITGTFTQTVSVEFSINNASGAKSYTAYQSNGTSGSFSVVIFAVNPQLYLRLAGHPARFIFCHCPGGYHLVAECNGWVLDNRYTDVMTKPLLERDGYSWISASGTKPGDSWRAIE